MTQENLNAIRVVQRLVSQVNAALTPLAHDGCGADSTGQTPQAPLIDRIEHSQALLSEASRQMAHLPQALRSDPTIPPRHRQSTAPTGNRPVDRNGS